MKKLITALRVLWRAIGDRILMSRNAHLRRAFEVDSHLTVRERIALYDLAKDRNTICEIGSYIGASACCFGQAARGRSDARVLCIDTWQNDAMSEGGRDTWTAFSNNTADYRESITPIRGFSHDVVDQVAGIADSVDLLFIDGDHSYEGVLRDWTEYRRFLKPGSVVVFHDYGWAEGVQKLVKEEFLPVSTDFQCLPNMCWGTVSQ